MSACTPDCGDICCAHCWDVALLRAEVERLAKDMAEQLDDSERIIAALKKERDEARAQRDMNARALDEQKERVHLARQRAEKAEAERDESIAAEKRKDADVDRYIGERDALKAALRDLVDAMEGGYDAPSESDAKKRAREALGEKS